MIQLYCHNDINEARGMAVANMKYFFISRQRRVRVYMYLVYDVTLIEIEFVQLSEFNVVKVFDVIYKAWR